MQVSIFGSDDIEDVGEVGCVANEFKDCGELLFLKTVNIVDGNNDGFVYCLECIPDSIMYFL